ncbi:hypothetical protein Pelo_1441 [Pelomyxa schiedti]|nr:hypothetical protein Pelo_1441 [Pelomyxa schiedti]
MGADEERSKWTNKAHGGGKQSEADDIQATYGPFRAAVAEEVDDSHVEPAPTSSPLSETSASTPTPTPTTLSISSTYRPTIRAAIDARSQFIAFACASNGRCGVHSPAKTLADSPLVCSEFGRDWVAGCCRRIGSTLAFLVGQVSAVVHVFIGVSSTAGVVWCNAVSGSALHARLGEGHWSVEGCVCDDKFVVDGQWDAPCVVDGAGNLVARLVHTPDNYDPFSAWASNGKWLVDVEEDAEERLYVRRVLKGVPVGDYVCLRWTAPIAGLFPRFSPFNPCGDELVLVGGTKKKNEERNMGGDAFVSPPGLMVFVDLEKSFVSGVIVETKRLPLTQHTPVGLMWSSPDTILTLHFANREYEVYSTTAGQLRHFPGNNYQRAEILPKEHVATFLLTGAPSQTKRETVQLSPPSSSSLCVCEVYSPNNFCKPLCCYERPLLGLPCSSASIYCLKMVSDNPEQIVASINDASMGICLAILTINHL